MKSSNHPSNTRTLTTIPTIPEEETTREGTRKITTVEVEDTVDGTTTTSTITTTTTTRVSTKGSTMPNTRQDMDSSHMAWATVSTISTRGADMAPIIWTHTVCSRTVQDTNRAALEERVDSMAKKTLSSLTKAKEREREVILVALAATQTCSSSSRDILKRSKEEQASSHLVFKVALVIARALLLRVLVLVLVEPTRVGPTRVGEEPAGRAIIK